MIVHLCDYSLATMSFIRLFWCAPLMQTILVGNNKLFYWSILPENPWWTWNLRTLQLLKCPCLNLMLAEQFVGMSCGQLLKKRVVSRQFLWGSHCFLTVRSNFEGSCNLCVFSSGWVRDVPARCGLKTYLPRGKQMSRNGKANQCDSLSGSAS